MNFNWQGSVGLIHFSNQSSQFTCHRDHHPFIVLKLKPSISICPSCRLQFLVFFSDYHIISSDFRLSMFILSSSFLFFAIFLLDLLFWVYIFILSVISVSFFNYVPLDWREWTGKKWYENCEKFKGERTYVRRVNKNKVMQTLG